VTQQTGFETRLNQEVKYLPAGFLQEKGKAHCVTLLQYFNFCQFKRRDDLFFREILTSETSLHVLLIHKKKDFEAHIYSHIYLYQCIVHWTTEREPFPAAKKIEEFEFLWVLSRMVKQKYETEHIMPLSTLKGPRNQPCGRQTKRIPVGLTPSVLEKLAFRTRFVSNIGNINHQ
jgi:hypothetical protein